MINKIPYVIVMVISNAFLYSSQNDSDMVQHTQEQFRRMRNCVPCEEIDLYLFNIDLHHIHPARKQFRKRRNRVEFEELNQLIVKLKWCEILGSLCVNDTLNYKRDLKLVQKQLMMVHLDEV